MTTSLWIWCMNALLFNRGRSTEEWGLILYSRTPILRLHWDLLILTLKLKNLYYETHIFCNFLNVKQKENRNN